jgi:hypothetical protein
MGPTWVLSDDRKTVTAIFPTEPPVSLSMDARGLDGLLRNLAEVREAMAEQHPLDFALGQKVSALHNPRWVTEPDLMNWDSLVHLRHPGYGWLHFLIPKAEAAKLAGSLQAQAQTQPEPPPARPN